jgi:S-formylglutathione hydrolase FrmB
MTRRCAILIITCTVLLAASAFAQGTVVVDQLYSPILDQTKSVRVYLPEGYDEAADPPYPVYYFLHGANSYALDPSNNYIFSILDDLIGNGDPGLAIRPAVLVMADGSAPPFAGSMYANSELYGNYEDYIVTDVIGYAEANYNVRSDKFGRIMTGLSMGAMGSMSIGLQHPELFCALGAISGALDFSLIPTGFFLSAVAEQVGQGEVPPYDYNPADGLFTYLLFTGAGGYSPNVDNPPYGVDLPLDGNGDVDEEVFARWFDYDATTLLSAVTPGDLAFFVTCGETDELAFFPQNQSFAALLDELGHVYQYVTDPGGHFDTYYVDRFYAAFPWLDDFFQDVVATEVSDPTDELPVTTSTRLVGAAPNPFNPQTVIEFDLARPQVASLTIHDLRGRTIARLVDGIVFDAGTHRLEWAGRDLAGRELPSGTYVARLVTTDRVTTLKLQLVR